MILTLIFWLIRTASLKPHPNFQKELMFSATLIAWKCNRTNLETPPRVAFWKREKPMKLKDMVPVDLGGLKGWRMRCIHVAKDMVPFFDFSRKDADLTWFSKIVIFSISRHQAYSYWYRMLSRICPCIKMCYCFIWSNSLFKKPFQSFVFNGSECSLLNLYQKFYRSHTTFESAWCRY